MASNAKLGKLILCIAFSIFLYYFFWIAILPFMRVEEGKNKTRITNVFVLLIFFCFRRQLDPLQFPAVGIRICDTSYIRYIICRLDYDFHNVPCQAIYFVFLMHVHFYASRSTITSTSYLLQAHSFEKRFQLKHFSSYIPYHTSNRIRKKTFVRYHQLITGELYMFEQNLLERFLSISITLIQRRTQRLPWLG